MDDLLFRLLLGHFIGDYLLQNHWMALNKKKRIWPLLVHCLIYTAVVCILTPELFSPLWLTIVFTSHAVIDGTHIVDKYLHIIGGRSIANMRHDFNSLTSCAYAGDTPLMRTSSVAIGWFVQIVADNTIHIGLMYAGLRWLQI